MSNHNDSHYFVVVKKDIVCLSWILAYLLKTSIKKLFDLFHELSSIQKSDCWNKSVTFDKIKQSTIGKVQEEVEWNQWKEVIYKLCVDISETDFGNILYLLVSYLICVLQEKFEDAVKQEHCFHNQLEHVEVIDFLLSEHLCINLIWSFNPFLCVRINAIFWCFVCTWLFVLILRETKVINIIPESCKVSICE